MSQIAAFAKLTAVADKRDALVAELESDFSRVQAEAGTLVYAVHADKREPDVVWAYELYESRDALFAHGEWAAASLERVAHLLAEPAVVHFASPLYGKGVPFSDPRSAAG